MAEKKTKEQMTKVSLETQFENSNIKEYEESDLVKMVNATSGDGDFKTAYPDATFSRTLAYKYLQAKYDYDFVGRSYMVPHGVTIDDLLDAYEKQKGSEGGARESRNSTNGVDIVEVDVNEKKKRQTLSMNAGTLQRWNHFTKENPNKSLYLTAACELFMSKVMEGTVKIKPIIKLGYTPETMLKLLGVSPEEGSEASGEVKKLDKSSEAEEF